MSQCVVVIPARYASSRFPGKPLVQIAGRPMIQHVYERARQACLVQHVLVATDDRRIVEAVEAFGGQAVMTAASHATGSDRVAEVAARLTCDIVVNVQGDEPGIVPQVIDALIQPFYDDASIPMTTLARPLRDVAELLTPHVVKVVVDQGGQALYFSRAPMPYHRQAWPQGPHLLAAAGTMPALPPGCLVHCGLYAYRRDFLLQIAQWPQTPLEQIEHLEQLRVLERGYRIHVVQTSYESVGVDTPDDIARVERILAGRLSAQP
jgi:3-deoxy-manno-octulosonate cytidylyltransferase (CMP-KDO synthetase)